MWTKFWYSNSVGDTESRDLLIYSCKSSRFEGGIEWTGSRMPFLKETTGKRGSVDETVLLEALDVVEGFEVALEQDEFSSDRDNF